MLELRNITISLKNDGRIITDDFSFTLDHREKAVIIGEEGNGKSTLLKFIYQRELIEKYCDCSGGEKVKVQLARLLMDEPDVLLLNEPTRNFSPLSGPVVRAALRGFGGTIISVSLDRKYLVEVCDKIYELRENGLVPIDCLCWTLQ